MSVRDSGKTILPKESSDSSEDKGGESEQDSLPVALQNAKSGPDYYQLVGKEILEERLEPTAWARALEQSKGTRDEALTHYVRHRVEALEKDRERRADRGLQIDERKTRNFKDFHSEQVIPQSLEGERGSFAILDACFWHGVAVVGMIGSLLAVGFVWPELGFRLNWQVAFTAVIMMQAIPAVAWWYGRRADYTLSYSRVAQMVAVIAMLASVVVGVKLLGHPFGHDGMELVRKHQMQKVGAELRTPVVLTQDSENKFDEPNTRAQEIAER